jgi:uncharacterized SAM-binding protein YcdF (DUF218 family)
VFLILAGVWAALFAISFLREKRRFRNAVYLMMCVISLALEVIAHFRGDMFPPLLAVAVLLLLSPLLLVGVSVMFVWCGVTSIRKEGLRLPNVLSIAFPVVMWSALAFVVWSLGAAGSVSPAVVYAAVLVGMLGLYVSFTFAALFLYSVLYRMVPQRADFDFIVIHGAGLMPDGSVTPLLAGRCDKAFRVFEGGGSRALIIASGGQGPDEANSEAQAMCDYLVLRGVPREHILLEDESANTYQNMANSKRIVDEVSAERGIASPSCVFVTSDYHVFRTATYARRVGLKADGVGSRTARYYFPNAFIREYVAVMLEHRWALVLLVAVWVLGVVVSSLGM